MTIQTSVPSSIRRPGVMGEFRFVPGGQSLVAVPQRVVIVAEVSSAATATDEVPVQVFDEIDADAKCGRGSFAALMCRVAFEQIKLSGNPVEVWICPTIEPAGGTAAVNTITITGPATESKDLVFRIAGRTVTVGVTSGDAQNTIAAAIESKLDEMVAVLPVTASVNTNVVTCTCPTKGVNGNDIVFDLVSKPAGVGVAFAQSVAGAGAAPVTNPLAALYDARYHAICLNNHVTADAATVLADVAARWGYAQKNYGFVFLGERGSLGTAQTLQASYNDYRVVIINCEQSPSLPGELAVAAAVAEFGREAPNANLDGERLAIVPPSATYAYTNAEIESALNGGVTPLTPDGPFAKIERLVTTQITLNSAPFEPLRDIAFPRTAAYVAEQVHFGWLTGFRQEVITDDPEDDIRGRVRDMVIDKHRAMQRQRYIRNVDDFIDFIQVEEANVPSGRLVVTDPFRVAGPLHQGVFVHTMYQ
jgi:phage tail sheath gpL-like